MAEPGGRARVKVWCAEDAPDAQRRAHALADQLGLALVRQGEWRDADLLLTVTRGGLELRDPGAADRRGFAVDFRALAAKFGHRTLSRRQPIAKAFGRDVVSIVDATAGWCHDAMLLTKLGYAVVAVERSPIVAALVRDALERAPATFMITQGEARDILPALDPWPDAVYIDPMYPPRRKKSARARKSIELLRALVGDDPDAGELFDVAWHAARRRVVVKRADDAPPIAPNPTSSHGGKTVRYDVYVTMIR